VGEYFLYSFCFSFEHIPKLIVSFPIYDYVLAFCFPICSFLYQLGSHTSEMWIRRVGVLKFCCSPHADSSTENYYYEDDILSNGY